MSKRKRCITSDEATPLDSQPKVLAGKAAAALRSLLAARARPAGHPGWKYVHERQAELINRDGWMCEQHPGLPFEHEADCAGPGMPWAIEGREAIEKLLARRSKLEALGAKALEMAMEPRKPSLAYGEYANGRDDGKDAVLDELESSARSLGLLDPDPQPARKEGETNA